MIDVSARIVGSGTYSQYYTSNTGDYLTTGTINIQLPDCDYVELESAYVEIPYATAVTSSTASLKTECVYMPPNKVILVAGGGSSLATAMSGYRSSGSTTYSRTTLTVSLGLDHKLTSGEFNYNNYSTLDVKWHYTCYKYDS